MELDDCAFPLLQGMVLTDDPKVAFKDADWCLLVGAKPRGPGMERADLLKDNGDLHRAGPGHRRGGRRRRAGGRGRQPVQHQLHDRRGQADAPRRRAVHGHDPPRPEPRRASQLAQKAGVPVTEVTDMVIYGNHSPDDVRRLRPRQDRRPAGRRGHRRRRPGCEETFLPTVGKRGAAIIEARGLSSAASAANAPIDHVRSLITPGSDDDHSLAVPSDGQLRLRRGRLGLACRCGPRPPADVGAGHGHRARRLRPARSSPSPTPSWSPSGRRSPRCCSGLGPEAAAGHLAISSA